PAIWPGHSFSNSGNGQRTRRGRRVGTISCSTSSCRLRRRSNSIQVPEVLYRQRRQLIMAGDRERSTAGVRRSWSAQVNAQSGQGLVWGMLMLGVMTIAYLAYFGVSEMVAAKARQTHALDA